MEEEAWEYLSIFPVVAILGPRQAGKSTLAKSIAASWRGDSVYLDLEDRRDLAKLDEAEIFFTEHSDRLIVLDEIQRRPDLFPVLRGFVDNCSEKTRFIVLGSASGDLLRQSSESLAGRIGYLELTPFSLLEVDDPRRLWTRGGFPRSYLAGSERTSFIWRSNFIKTFLQKDIPMLGLKIPPLQLEHFWVMLAHSHGQCLNASALAQNFGVSVPTIKRYLSILEGTYMVAQLRPYSANVKKRLVRTPKIYIRDTGVLHALLDIRDMEDLEGHPIIGASYEGWVIEQIAAATRKLGGRHYFYRTHAGAEIDLLLELRGELVAVEIKRSLSPKVERGFHEACDTLSITGRHLVYPGSESYTIGNNVRVSSVSSLINDLLS